MNLHHYTTLLFVLLLTFASSAQKRDFDNYQTLRSQGEIPKDFNTSTLSKIQADLAIRRENFTTEEQKEFTERIHMSVDELLQSGKVIYGDEISQYVSDVAKILLKDDPELFAKLRFYTVKSNITNALSTDQGIILVTTGLISQITSEAELAYVLAHEIVHFTEKHTMEWYEFSQKEDVIRKMQEMSVYSQDKEFEADTKGIDLYLKAGYGKENMTTLFDVLAYSYLPIDEIPFPETYFNSSICDIPKKKFPTEQYEIKLDENYDDRRSTHPNIKRRKTKALETADTLENWGKENNLLGTERLNYVRTIARFERLRDDMLDKSYDQAIYTIFVLERKYPESKYLTRMKCQAWYGLSQQYGSFTDDYYDYEYDYDYEYEYYDDDFGYEGEIAKFQVFLENIKGIEIATIAMRVVEDSRAKYSEDPEIQELWKRTAKELVINREFELDDFSDVTYNEYVKNAEEADSLKPKVFTDEEIDNLTKYQKIRSKRKVAEKIAVLDSTNYYKYIISDLITNEEFIALNEKFKDFMPDDEFDDYYYDYEDDYDLSRKEKRALKKERKKEEKNYDEVGEPVDLSTIIIIDPFIAHYEAEQIESEKSEKLLVTFSDAIKEVAQERNINSSILGKGNMGTLTTESFNQKCLYVDLIEQLNMYDSYDAFPVDYTELDNLEKDQENRKIIFISLVNNLKEAEYSRYRKPSLKTRIKSVFKKTPNASMYILIMDPKTNEINLQKNTVFKKGGSKSEIKKQFNKLLDTKVEVEDEEGLDYEEEIIEEMEEDIPPPPPPVKEDDKKE